MKQGWEIKKLGEVCDFYRGLTYSKKDEVEISSTGVLRSNNIDLANNQLNLEEIKYISDSIIVPKDKKIKKGSLLICTANGSKSHLGKVALIDEDYNYAFGGFMGLMVPHKQIMTPKYFYYSLITSDYKNYIKKLSDGANINNLKFKDLQLFEIPVPSLLEQGRIVGVLDAAFAKIDALKGNAQKNLENAKALFQQVLKQELTPKPNWQTKKLGEVCKYIKEQGSYSNLPYVGMEDIEPETNKYLGKLIPKNVKSTTFKFHQGYVLFGRLRPYLRKVLTPKFEGHCSTEIFPIQPCQDINCEFLRFWFLDNIDDINRTCTGARMPRANMNDVLNFVISYPQIDEQEEIVLKIENITQKSNKVIANAEKTIAECDALKQAVLRRAFNGEL